MLRYLHCFPTCSLVLAGKTNLYGSTLGTSESSLRSSKCKVLIYFVKGGGSEASMYQKVVMVSSFFGGDGNCSNGDGPVPGCRHTVPQISLIDCSSYKQHDLSCCCHEWEQLQTVQTILKSRKTFVGLWLLVYVTAKELRHSRIFSGVSGDGYTAHWPESTIQIQFFYR